MTLSRETDPDGARARTLVRRAWFVFGLSLPIAIGGGLLGGVPYALARGLDIWGYSLGILAVFTFIPALVILRRSTALTRARISLGLSVALILIIVWVAIFGIRT